VLTPSKRPDLALLKRGLLRLPEGVETIQLGSHDPDKIAALIEQGPPLLLAWTGWIFAGTGVT
jgi:hypothetical protein